MTLLWTQVRHKKILREIGENQIYNHVAGIHEIGQKSSLLMNLQNHYQENIANFVPETYCVKLDRKYTKDPEFRKFK